ncbi:glycosyltransferase family 1 protein [Shewanella sp. GutDb-MelDb]|nr:glycosyltransferase family 1 protein [Shewanella sp. GutDb-MelDb]
MKTNSKHKIAVIASFPDSVLSFRGALISAIQQQNYEVHVIAPYMEDDLLQELQRRGIVVHQISLQRTGMNPFSDVKYFIQLFKVLREINPDYSIAYTIKPVIYGTLAAKLAGVKNTFSLITGLGYAFTGEAKGKRKVIQYLLHLLYKAALKTNKLVFFQNNDDKALFQQLKLVPKTSNPVVVNGSGIDVSEFSEVPLPNSCDFLLIARLLGDKGIREYAGAARLLKQSHPNSTCRLVGFIDVNPDAIKQHELDEWIDGGYIEYIGRLSNVQPAIEQCTVYVLPSYREGTPRSVLEAMAMGRPIITTDAPGCRETVIDGENGYLVPVQDSHALYENMVKLTESRELVVKMGKASREIVEEKFDVHKVNHAMLTAMGIK